MTDNNVVRWKTEINVGKDLPNILEEFEFSIFHVSGTLSSIGTRLKEPDI